MTSEKNQNNELLTAEVSPAESKIKPDYEGEIVSVIRGNL